jgi:hypothetical protein
VRLFLSESFAKCPSIQLAVHSRAISDFTGCRTPLLCGVLKNCD